MLTGCPVVHTGPFMDRQESLGLKLDKPTPIFILSSFGGFLPAAIERVPKETRGVSASDRKAFRGAVIFRRRLRRQPIRTEGAVLRLATDN